MAVNDTRQQDTEHRSRHHDGGEDQRPELGDGKENKNLPRHRRQRDDGNVSGKRRITHHESDGVHHAATDEKRHGRQQTGETIHVKHHLHGGDLVLLEQMRLPVGRETVETHVPDHEDETR